MVAEDLSNRKAPWWRSGLWLAAALSAGCGVDAGLPLEADPDLTGATTQQLPVDSFVAIEAPREAPPCRPDQYYVGRLMGRLLDYRGRPVARGQVSVCGTACIPGETDADGYFDVLADACFGASSEYAHGVAFSFTGLDARPDVFYDFNRHDARQMGTVRFLRPIYVSDYTAGGRAPAPPRVQQAMRLVNDRGFALTVVPSTLEYPLSAVDEVVRVVQVPLSKLPPYEGASPVVMYAISPSDTTLGAPAPVEFPNTVGLAPGTLVEVVAVGNHASAGNPPVGVLGAIDVGRVSPDGQRVVAQSGLRFFGTVGYRVVSR